MPDFNRENDYKKIRIFTIHHGSENFPDLKNSVTSSILCGEPGRYGYRIALKDGNGHARSRYFDPDLYSEFAAIFWLWDERWFCGDYNSDYIGFMHYRSFLNLGIDTEEPYQLSDLPLKNVGMTERKILAAMANWDILTSDPLTDFGNMTIREQFAACHPLADEMLNISRDLLVSTGRIKKKDFDEYFDTRGMKPYFKCLTVFGNKEDCFNNYIGFVMYSLMEVEQRLQTKIMKLPNEKSRDYPTLKTRFRLLAFLGERLTAFFIYDAIKNGRFKVKTYPRAHYDKLSEMLSAQYGSDKETLIPLYRFFCLENRDHVMVTDLKEVDTMASKGYVCEGCVGYVKNASLKHDTGTDELIRLWSGQKNDHVALFQSFDLPEYKRRGYGEEGILGRAFLASGVGRIPLYSFQIRYKATGEVDKISTTNLYELDEMRKDIRVEITQQVGETCYICERR